MRKNLLKQKSGFTLIELLVVITIIVALAVTVFVALNPAGRLEEARDARRTSDIDSILTAIHQAVVDADGLYPSNMPAAGTTAQIGTGLTGCNTYGTASVACGSATLCASLMTGTRNLTAYLKSMPTDPLEGTATETGYSVLVDTNGIVTVTACGSEGGTTIQTSR